MSDAIAARPTSALDTLLSTPKLADALAKAVVAFPDIRKDAKVTINTKAGGGFEFKYAVWEQLEWEAQRRGEPVLAADLRFGTHPAVEMGFGLGRATRIVDP